MDPSVAIALRLLAAIGVSVGLSLIVGRVVLRLDRRGAGVVGGVCAGVALGPAVLGGLAPGVYADWMVGGVVQSSAAARIEARLPGEIESLLASGVSEVAAAEHEAQERGEAGLLRREAERDRTLRRGAAGAIAASCALLAAVLLVRPGRVRRGALVSGVVAALLAGLTAAVAARVTLGVDISLAAVFGGVLAGGVIGWRGLVAARWFGLGAMGVCAVGLAVFAGVWTGVALAAFVGLGALIRVLDPVASGGRGARWTVEAVLVPTCSALVVSLAAADVDVGGAILIGAACLLAGDARLITLWIGANLCEDGNARARPLSTWLARFGRGGPGWQVLLLGLAVAGGGIHPATAEGAAMVYAVAGAALTSEIMRPSAYRAMRRYRREIG